MDLFVTRRPIFDRKAKTHAYSLDLRPVEGRNSAESHAAAHPREAYLSSPPDFTLLSEELGQIAGEVPAFVIFDRKSLLNGYPSLIPRQSVVVDLSAAGLLDDDEALGACRNLRSEGYSLALDDTQFEGAHERLASLVDVVKVPFSSARAGQCAETVSCYRRPGVSLLAGGVATQDDFARAIAAGFDLFEGRFYVDPVMETGSEIPVSKLSLVQLLREIYLPETDIAKVEQIIKREVALSYRLLTYLNSVAFGLRQPVSSIAHALHMLGERGVRKWASVAALTSLGTDRPFELVVTSVVRARFCESIASMAGLGQREQELFLLGLFSMVDALLGRPLADALEGLPISPAIKTALLGEASDLKPVYDLVVAYELGEWQSVSRLSSELSLYEAVLPGIYVNALEWGNASLSMQQAEVPVAG